MDTEKEIQRLKEIVKENNRILKKIQSKMRWATAWTIVKLVIYIGLAVGAWYYLEPIYEETMEAFRSVQEAGGAVTDLRNSEEFKPLMEYFSR